MFIFLSFQICFFMVPKWAFWSYEQRKLSTNSTQSLEVLNYHQCRMFSVFRINFPEIYSPIFVCLQLILPLYTFWRRKSQQDNFLGMKIFTHFVALKPTLAENYWFLFFLWFSIVFLTGSPKKAAKRRHMLPYNLLIFLTPEFLHFFTPKILFFYTKFWTKLFKKKAVKNI